MKSIIIIIALVLLIAHPTYAVNIIDTLMCEKVVLKCNGRTVLVNRLTGEVQYVKHDGKFEPLGGIFKHQCQMMYDVQRGKEQ